MTFEAPWLDSPGRPIVLAFGGNALLPDPDDSSGAEARAAEFAGALLLLLPEHAGLALVHGNGPQVGTILLRVEETRDRLPPETLDVLVAETQGSIGFLLTKALRNVLRRRGRQVEVATVVTQVVVDASDPAFSLPTKPIGPFYEPEVASALEREKGWAFTEVPDRGWRRVVPSPVPLRVVELHSIADAARHGHLIVAGGGGGIPVVEDESGQLRGVEAVIDKDRTAGLLAESLRAAGFVILTAVDAVYLNFHSEDRRSLPSLSAADAERLIAEGQFPAGSMGPKVEAAARYAERMERAALITSVEALPAALRGESGTWVTP